MCVEAGRPLILTDLEIIYGNFHISVLIWSLIGITVYILSNYLNSYFIL